MSGYKFFCLVNLIFSLNLFASQTYLKIEKLPLEIQKTSRSLEVDRKSSKPGSHMISLGYLNFVFPQKKYQFTGKNFRSVKQTKFSPEGENIRVTIPKYIILKDSWPKNGPKETSQANILGGTQTFFLDLEHLKIPVAKTTKENLKYYNCKLVKAGDLIEFETNGPLPLIHMSIGPHYVSNYLLKKGLGDGSYLEFHDRPHFHCPKDKFARGHLILGVQKKDGIHLSAFSIPEGYGIYTRPNVIHTDAYLIGEYHVIYSVTPNFSTVLLKNKKNKILPVFVQES